MRVYRFGVVMLGMCAAEGAVTVRDAVTDAVCVPVTASETVRVRVQYE